MERDFIWILAGLMFIRLLNVVSGIWRDSEYGFRESGRRGRAVIGLSLAILSWQIQLGYADVSFIDVANEAGLDALGRWEGATFGDYDRDGDLDLYIARYNGEMRSMRIQVVADSRIRQRMLASGTSDLVSPPSLEIMTMMGMWTSM